MASKTITQGKRSCAILSTCFLLLFSLVSVVCETTNLEEDACGYWKKMAADISKKKSHMYCSANSTDPCTQLKCQGTYKYRSWIMPSFSSVEIDFCFGVVMNHCEDPVSLDIYLDVPNRNLSYQNRVTHDELLKIPGGSFQTPSVQKVEAFLHFHMLKNGSYVNFSMAIKLKLTALDNLTIWPRGLQRVLVPEEKIPVPPCEVGRTGVSEPKPPSVCHPPHWRKNDDQSPISDLIPIEKPSGRYLRPCSDLLPCGETEVCNLKKGRCECYSQFKYDNITKVCKPESFLGKNCNTYISRLQCGFNELCKQQENQPVGKGVCACAFYTKYDELLHVCKYEDTAGDEKITKPEEKSRNGKYCNTYISRIQCGFNEFCKQQENQPAGKGVCTCIDHTEYDELLHKCKYSNVDTAGNKKIKKPEEKSSNAAAVAIGCLIVIIVVAAVIAGVYLVIRRKRRNYDRSVLLVNDDEDPLAM